MAWKLTSWGATRMPLTGVPWRDLSDAEFAVAEERYPELRARGYFEEAPLERSERPAARGRRATTAAPAPAPEPAAEPTPAPEGASEVTDSEEGSDD